MQQTLYPQDGAAYGSVQNVEKIGRLPVSKVRQNLLSKPSFRNFTLTSHQMQEIGHNSQIQKLFLILGHGLCC